MTILFFGKSSSTSDPVSLQFIEMVPSKKYDQNRIIPQFKKNCTQYVTVIFEQDQTCRGWVIRCEYGIVLICIPNLDNQQT